MRGLAYLELVQTGAAFRRSSVRGTDSSDRDAGLYRRKTIAFFEKRMACRSGFCRGWDSDNNHDTAPQQNRSGQALLSVGNALAFGLAGTLCIAVLFLEDTSKKQKAAGCVIFAVMLALCTALMRTSQGKNAPFPRIYAKGYRFCNAHEHALRPGRAALFTGCSCLICRSSAAGRKQKGEPAWAGLAAALWLGLTAACCLLFFTEDGDHAGGKPDLDLVKTACTAAGAALCGGMAGRRREKEKIRVKSYYLRESGLTNRPIACILYKNVSVPMAQRRISLCKEVPKGMRVKITPGLQRVQAAQPQHKKNKRNDPDRLEMNKMLPLLQEAHGPQGNPLGSFPGEEFERHV